MTDYKSLKLIASSSPHIRSNEDTRSIMLDVIIALMPALVMGVYVFGWRALTSTLVSVASCVVWEWIYRKLLKKSCSVGDLSAVVTGILLAFADDEEKYVAEPQCIRCGKCVGVCPMRLEPVFMYKYLEKGDVDTWQNVLHGMDCIECGACAYTCPARLPLTHMFRMGKQKVNNARMAAKAKAEAEKKAAEEKKEA